MARCNIWAQQKAFGKRLLQTQQTDTKPLQEIQSLPEHQISATSLKNKRAGWKEDSRTRHKPKLQTPSLLRQWQKFWSFPFRPLGRKTTLLRVLFPRPMQTAQQSHLLHPKIKLLGARTLVEFGSVVNVIPCRALSLISPPHQHHCFLPRTRLPPQHALIARKHKKICHFLTAKSGSAVGEPKPAVKMGFSLSRKQHKSLSRHRHSRTKHNSWRKQLPIYVLNIWYAQYVCWYTEKAWHLSWAPD